MEASNLQEALWNKRFLEAEDILKQDATIFTNIDSFNQSQFYKTILENKAFYLIDLLVDKGVIPMDLFEYDNFRNTIFWNLLTDMPTDDPSLEFFKNFCAQVENIDETVAGDSWLSFAVTQNAHPKILRVLIDSGCPVQYFDTGENSLIHQTIHTYGISPENKLAYLQLFVDEGVDVNHQNLNKETALHYAINQRKENIIAFLIANDADPSITDRNGCSAVYKAAVEQGDIELYKVLTDNYTPDFSETTPEGTTLLFEFLRRLPKNPSENELSILEKMIEQGADFDQPNTYYGNRTTPKQQLAQKSYTVFEKVMSLDAISITDTDNDGNTLLHYVCSFDSNYEEDVAKDTYRKVKLLLNKGVDSSVKNNSEQTPMDLALTDKLKEKVVALLLKK